MMRTYAGHSSATASNELTGATSAKGQTGLSVAFDLPTQTGYDPDHRAGPGRGRQGGRARSPHRRHAHAVRRHPAGRDEHVDDDQRHRDVAARRCTSPSPRSSGVAAAALSGTTQNDIVKEYLSRGTYIFPPGAEPAADHRHDRLHGQRHPQVEPDQHLQLPPAGGRRDARAGDRLRAGHRDRRARRRARLGSGAGRATSARWSGGSRFFVNAGRALRRGDVQDARVRRSCGTSSPSSATASPTPSSAGSATACRSTPWA